MLDLAYVHASPLHWLQPVVGSVFTDATGGAVVVEGIVEGGMVASVGGVSSWCSVFIVDVGGVAAAEGGVTSVGGNSVFTVATEGTAVVGGGGVSSVCRLLEASGTSADRVGLPTSVWLLLSVGINDSVEQEQQVHLASSVCSVKQWSHVHGTALASTNCDSGNPIRGYRNRQ